MRVDTTPHLLVVTEYDGDKSYEIEHPGCPSETIAFESISGDPEAGPTYERNTCRLQYVLDYWGLDFLENPNGIQGWVSLDEGHYQVVAFSDGEDFGVTLLEPLPISESITMRPVWDRRQRRHYLQAPLEAPTEWEIADAIRVLEDEANQLLAPALYLEAFTIMDEASE